LAVGPDWVAALACASRSFCRKSLSAWATALPVRAHALPDADTGCHDQHQHESSSGEQGRAVAAPELAGAVGSRSRHCQHRFVLQVPSDIDGEIGG
jgi:hypothetical protein